MDRFVDVDKLKDELKNIFWYEDEDMCKVLDVLDKAPTVVPAKCGKWEKIPQLSRWWICTQCSHIINRVVLPHYCECCGARMDGDKE